MKRALALLCAALLLPALAGCGENLQRGFDAQTEGIVDVEVERRKGILSWDETGPHGYTLASGGRIMDAEPFEPDDMTVYDARECFESYIDREQNKVLNRLVSTTLLDGERRELEADEKKMRILRRVAELEHDLLEVEILDTGSGMFVHVGLNVNLWSPYSLYYYDEVADRLVELHKWDGERVVGLRVRNLGLLRQDES